ncbi:hypothetical protein [Anaerosporobacter sp.]
MKKIDIIKFVCAGGMLTALAVLFQSAPVFLAALGLLLSTLSTLPIAIAAVSNVSLGFCVLLSSALILTLISVQEAIILLLSTGLLGIVIGALLYKKGIIISIVFSSISLALGMICLTYIIGIPAFLDFANSLSTSLTLIIFFLFSLAYASIWNFCLIKFVNYLKRIKAIR